LKVGKGEGGASKEGLAQLGAFTSFLKRRREREKKNKLPGGRTVREGEKEDNLSITNTA